MIEVRVATKIDQEVNILQSGFRPKMGTTEGTFNLRTKCERALEVGKEVHIYVSLTIPKKANRTSSLLPIIKKRKCQYFLHAIRARSIQKLLLKGKIEGKRGQGRPRDTWMKKKSKNG